MCSTEWSASPPTSSLSGIRCGRYSITTACATGTPITRLSPNANTRGTGRPRLRASCVMRASCARNRQPAMHRSPRVHLSLRSLMIAGSPPHWPSTTCLPRCDLCINTLAGVNAAAAFVAASAGPVHCRQRSSVSATSNRSGGTETCEPGRSRAAVCAPLASRICCDARVSLAEPLTITLPMSAPAKTSTHVSMTFRCDPNPLDPTYFTLITRWFSSIERQNSLYLPTSRVSPVRWDRHTIR